MNDGARGASVRIALVGMGRMGRALDALAPERGCEVVARLDAAAIGRGVHPDDLGGAEVAIDFTVPDAAVDNAIACLRAGCPVVIGTTGWAARRSELEQVVAETGRAALWSPNFSIGVQLFLAVAEEAARRLRDVRMRDTPAFDVHVVETHHSAKRDAPSGTGIAIAERLEGELGHPVAVSSVRVGSVPGTHEVVMDAPFEQIRLVHEARDRRVFADGALVAARWLTTVQVPALYTMRDVLAGDMLARSGSGGVHE